MNYPRFDSHRGGRDPRSLHMPSMGHAPIMGVPSPTQGAPDNRPLPTPPNSIVPELMQYLDDVAERERSCFRFFPAGKVMVPCQGSGTLKIQMQRTGDTYCEKLLMYCKGPVTSEGLTPSTVSVPTGYPSGLQTAAGVDLAESGLTVNIVEGSTGRKLIENFADVATFATPGYSGVLYEMLDLAKYLNGDNYLYFDFRNRDVAKDSSNNYLYHSVSVVLVAAKFQSIESKHGYRPER